MNEIRVSFDRQVFLSKPTEDYTPVISNRIGRYAKQLRPDEIRSFAFDVSLDGHTFCPATFKDGKRNKENFEQQQFLALDFDNKDPDTKVSFESIKARAEHYDLPILFAYDTLSSKNRNKFRVVFLNDVSIPHRKVAEAMQLAMGTIFPEADPLCYKDISKMYFGGKEMLHYDDKIPEINIASVFNGLSYCLKEKYKANHYKEKIAKFSQETGIGLTENGLLDVTVTEEYPTESSGATQTNQDGKNSPSSIIYSINNYNIIGNGEIFPNHYYRINFNVDSDDTGKSSVGKTIGKKTLKNHEEYRSSVLTKMRESCQLYRDFETGKRKLSHNELFGLATNLIQVDSGSQKFKDVLSENSVFYADKHSKWEHDLTYMKQLDYRSQACNGFCPYQDKCVHYTSILSTVHPKRGME